MGNKKLPKTDSQLDSGSPPEWYIYVLRCADDSLYTGITIDVQRRVEEHNGDDRLAARYTRPRRPVTLVYKEGCPSRSQAAKRESEIKKLSKADKEALILAGAKAG